jgi:hypothetical protein
LRLRLLRLRLLRLRLLRLRLLPRGKLYWRARH